MQREEPSENPPKRQRNEKITVIETANREDILRPHVEEIDFNLTILSPEIQIFVRRKPIKRGRNTKIVSEKIACKFDGENQIKCSQTYSNVFSFFNHTFDSFKLSIRLIFPFFLAICLEFN